MRARDEASERKGQSVSTERGGVEWPKKVAMVGGGLRRKWFGFTHEVVANFHFDAPLHDDVEFAPGIALLEHDVVLVVPLELNDAAELELQLDGHRAKKVAKEARDLDELDDGGLGTLGGVLAQPVQPLHVKHAHLLGERLAWRILLHRIEFVLHAQTLHARRTHLRRARLAHLTDA